MYKIVFLSMSGDEPLQDHNFNLLDESFETKDEAIKFVKDVLVREDVLDFIGGDEEMEKSHYFELEEYNNADDYEISHAVYYKKYYELVYVNKYKIVEVK